MPLNANLLQRCLKNISVRVCKLEEELFADGWKAVSYFSLRTHWVALLVVSHKVVDGWAVLGISAPHHTMTEISLLCTSWRNWSGLRSPFCVVAIWQCGYLTAVLAQLEEVVHSGKTGSWQCCWQCCHHVPCRSAIRRLSLKESCLLWWKYHHGMRYTVRDILKILRTLLWTSLASPVALRARKILALDLD